jgi:hypothetical protein
MVRFYICRQMKQREVVVAVVAEEEVVEVVAEEEKATDR